MLHTAMISSGDLGKESVVGIRTRDYQKKEKKNHATYSEDQKGRSHTKEQISKIYNWL